MALNKVKIPIASGSRSELDLPADHHTSMNFLLGQPVYYRHMPKKEHVVVPFSGVIRPEALAKPTFGRCRNNLRAFFVPYRLVFPNYDHLRENVIASNYGNSSLVQSAPYITMKTLTDYFSSTSIVGYGPLVELLSSYDPTDPNETRHHDFSLSGTPTLYYRYTPIGRRYYKLLKALGYKLIWDSALGSFKYDILALLCYARVYLDWYANSQYLDSNAVLRLEQIMKYNDPTSAFECTTTDFGLLMSLVFRVTYDSDSYFIHCWDNPASPTNSQYILPQVVDITDPNASTIVTPLANGTPFMRQVSASQPSIGTQYIHDMLQRLQNYQMRHALSGARVIDRVLADYGMIPENLTLTRSIYVGNNSMDVQIGDVMSHADTNPNGVSNLGAYAGRGYAEGKGSWEFSCDEDGLFLVVSTIIPSGGFVQGYDRNNRHLSIYDFYDPNFEVGVQVLEKGEVYISGNDGFSQGTSYTTGFGFTGRYGEYKRPISWDSSENGFDSINFGVDPWTLFRKFDDASFGGDIDNLVHSLDFTIGSDWDTYNRIFQYVGNERDPFECFYHFECHAYSPMKPLFETYDFKEMNKTIKMDINGTTLN